MEKAKYTLKILYDNKEGGMFSLSEIFEEKSEPITLKEQKEIVEFLQAKGYAIFQGSLSNGYRGALTQKGIEFVELNLLK